MTEAKLIHYTPTKIIRPEDISEKDLEALSNDSFAIWCLTSGAKVDGHDIDFNDHRYLLPLYMDPGQIMVLTKAAQMGATVLMLLKMLWWLKMNPNTKGGIFFPTRDGVENLSRDRLTPMIASVPEITEIASTEDKLGLRQIGTSSMYLLHLGGTASKDSVPMDFIAFDEVRLVSAADIDQAQERISHSKHAIEMYMSTAGMPGLDIDARFQRGTRHIWLSKCGCESGCDLATAFPACVINSPKHGLQLQCPKCRWIIKNPQNGRYVAEAPDADYNSYRISQLISRFMPLNKLWNSYNTTTNMQEFWNAKLGLPYIDAENQGVGMSTLKGCINKELQWGREESKDASQRCAMGVDIGAGYAMAVIMDYSRAGKARLRHVEIIEQQNPDYYRDGEPVTPFKRLYDLMEEYNVKICVCDAMPNSDLTMAFQRAFPSRVYLAFYLKGGKDPVTWGDRGKQPVGLAKTGPLMKSKHKVVLDRFMSISNTLGVFANHDIDVPPPGALVQICRVESGEGRGTLAPEAVCERLFHHLTRAVRKTTILNEETQEKRVEWVYSHGDPHLLHASNYAVTALDRMGKGGSSFSFV